jgi:hypothetical protein
MLVCCRPHLTYFHWWGWQGDIHAAAVQGVQSCCEGAGASGLDNVWLRESVYFEHVEHVADEPVSFRGAEEVVLQGTVGIMHEIARL